MTPFSALMAVASIMRTEEESTMDAPVSVTVSEISASTGTWAVYAHVARQNDAPRELYVVTCHALEPEAALKKAAESLGRRSKAILDLGYFSAKAVLES